MKILKSPGLIFFAILFLISCQKELSLEDGGGISGAGSWQFTEAGTLYTGNVDSAVLSTTGVAKTLSIIGVAANQAEKFSIVLSSVTDFAVGSYSASLSQAEFRYFTQAKTIFQGDFLSGEFVVDITSLANNTIEGTFSGIAKDSTGTEAQILLGKFKSAINLGTGGGAIEATGVLNSNGTACAPIQVDGVYTQGIALTGTNTIQVEVNVATTGTYAIATNTVNGVSFSATGSFSETGVQNVTLTGTGIPTDSSQFNYSLSFKTSTCDFQVSYLPGTPPPPPPVGDYFPTTPGSFWVYDYSDGTTQDSILTSVNNNMPVINGNTYISFLADAIPANGVSDTMNYRKANGEYFEALNVFKYFEIDAPVTVEYIFLKDNVPAGTIYKSTEYSAQYNGVPITGYIESTILDKAATADVGGQTYSDVIKVKNEYFVTLVAGFPAVSQYIEERWYAKGVGLIYLESDAGQTLILKRSQVN
ncbi:MAG: hypothetical protein ABIR81_12205 [Ginsengibacter sp.]